MDLQYVGDRFALQDLMARYAGAVDSRSMSDLASIFTLDAQLSFAATGGPQGGVEKMSQWLEEVLALMPASQHLVTNMLVEISGDQASGRCACLNPMALRDDSHQDQQVMFYGLFYRLTFRRLDQGWRIQTLEQEKAFHHNLPAGMPV